MNLTAGQKKEFKQKGFLVLRRVIPKPLVESALRQINHDLSGSLGRQEPPPYTGPHSWNHHTGAEAVRDLLFKTPAWPLAESLVGKGKVELVSNDAQIVLRFPVLKAHPDPAPYHIDDFFNEDGVLQDLSVKTYTALMCVLLSDVPSPWCGNFTVCPGWHRRLEKEFRRRGLQSLEGGLPLKAPRPVQITGGAGDLILMHHLLPHEAEQNLSPHIRYAAFFRLRHVDHPRRWMESFRDVWLEWPGLR